MIRFDWSRLMKQLPFLLLLILIIGCTEKPSPFTSKYVVYLRGDNNHKEYLAGLDKLSAGKFDPIKQGIELDTSIYYDLYYHQGLFYDVDEANKIRKFIPSEGNLKLVGSCTLPNITEIETHTFTSDGRLLVIGLDSIHRNPVYTLIDLQRFKVIKYGIIPIPDDGSYQRTSVGFVRVNNNKLCMTYVYHDMYEHGKYDTQNRMGLITLNYPEMTFHANSFNEKTVYEPKNGRHQPTMATEASGDLYFITNTSEGYGNEKTLPSGILRMKQGKTEIDPDLFINLSEAIPQCSPVGIWCMSDGKYLVKCELCNLVNTPNDYLEGNIYGYYDVDVATGKVSRLSIPLNKAWYTDDVLVEEGKAYIAVISGDNYMFWVYDPIDKSLREGLKFSSDVKRLFSINKR